MKRFILCFFMAVMYGANVFGASSDVSRIVSNKTLEKLDSEHSGELNRSSRRVNVATNNKSDKENKTVASRTAVSRPGVTVRGESTASRGLSKSSGVVSRAGAKNTARTATETNANIVTRTTQTETANSGGATRRSANVMSRPAKENTSERVRQSGTGDSEAKNQERALTSLFRKQVTPTAESITAAKDILEKTADLNSVCQKQYNDCMDQFCAVVDANQKRCSCSDNLNKYAKVQKAVEDANAQLNEVAQNIRYLGLSADEIRAIMNATEAELELTKTKDTSQTRSMLEDIADMIKDPTSAATSYWSSNNDSMFDLDFDFTSEASDLFSLDFFSSRTNDISSKRGKDLYNEATKRCKTVLKQCKEAGGTESQISGNYDLEISKDCVAYEQGLEKLNQTLLTNVRSANLMLQKGRLAVLQNKNQYDARGCIAALENCMLDEMVCGENYLKCLDPTKNYIDENGKVVLGRNITNITRLMSPNGMPDPNEGYNNTKITAEFIQNAVTGNDTTCSSSDGACIVNYLMSKIGTGPNVKSGGLCRAVLDKCQDYTYDYDGKTSIYRPYNEVIVNYIQRALVNIHAAQTQIISDYASTCMNEVSECYNQQISQINSFSTTASANSVYSIMTGACYNVALTCGYAVFAYDMDVGAQVNAVPEGAGAEAQRRMVVIRAISDLFYQSLLCPSNSTFQTVAAAAPDSNMTIGGYVNTRCRCNTGYSVWGGSCVPVCGAGEYRTSYGSCETCADGLFPTGSVCGQEYSYCGSGGYTVSCEGYGGETYDCSGVANSHSDSSCNYYGASANGTRQGCATFACKCNNGFTSWGGSCRASCSASEYASPSTGGACTPCNNGTPSGGSSIMENTACIIGGLTPTGDCLENSSPVTYSGAASPNGVLRGYYYNNGTACRCESNYVTFGGACIAKCTGANYYHSGRDGSCGGPCNGQLQYPDGYDSTNADPIGCTPTGTSNCPNGLQEVGEATPSTNGMFGGIFNYNGYYCKCGDNQVKWGTGCIDACSYGQYHNGTNGICTTCTSGILQYPNNDSTNYDATGCQASSTSCPSKSEPYGNFLGVLHGVSGVIRGTFTTTEGDNCQCNEGKVSYLSGTTYSCVNKCTGENEYHDSSNSCATCTGTLTYTGACANNTDSCEATGCDTSTPSSGTCEEGGAIQTETPLRNGIQVRTIGGYISENCVCPNSASVWYGETTGTYQCVTPICAYSDGDYRGDDGECHTCQSNQVPRVPASGMESDGCVSASQGTCPDNSVTASGVRSLNRKIEGFPTDDCQCVSGYSVWNGLCKSECSAANNQYRNDSGECRTCLLGTIYSHDSGYESDGCCPQHTTPLSSPGREDVNRSIGGNMNEYCKCDSGYSVWDGTCKTSCNDNQYRDNNGTCQSCPSGQEPSGGTSGVMENSSCVASTQLEH